MTKSGDFRHACKDCVGRPDYSADLQDYISDFERDFEDTQQRCI
jgi:hypothetical protein